MQQQQMEQQQMQQPGQEEEQQGDSEVDLKSLFAPTAACGGTCGCSKAPFASARNAVRFYLHDQGAFDFEGLRPNSGKIDAAMEINRAEHFTDFFVIDALRNHPQRVFQPHLANVHILAVLPFSSWVLQPKLHRRRMKAVANQLARTPHYLAGAPFVMVMSYWDVSGVLGQDLLEAMSEGNTILATSDSTYPDLMPAGHRGKKPGGRAEWLKTLVLPYRAHHVTERSAFRADQLWDSRPTSFMFHGWSGRSTRWPLLRERMVETLQRLQNTNVSLLDQRALGGSMSDQSDATAASARAMLENSVCLVPEGDTWTTRRLFDGLAAGCVPLLVRGPRTADEACEDELTLPFRATVNWSDVTLGVWELEPDASPQQNVAKLQRLANSPNAAKLLDGLRERGRRAFRQHLAVERYPHGVATALLRELKCSSLSEWVPDRRIHDQMNVNWDDAGRFGGVPYLADRLMVLPEQKLIMCAVEKNAITVMNVLAHAVLGLPRWKTAAEFWFRISPDVMSISPTKIRELLVDPSWRAAVVYRDPNDRFVSAYTSKCRHDSEEGGYHCGELFGLDKPSALSVAESLLNVSRMQEDGLLDDESTRLKHCTRFDPHWAPQTCFCTGLADTYHLYSNRISFKNISAGLKDFFQGRVSKGVLDRVETLLRDKATAVAASPQPSWHVTGAEALRWSGEVGSSRMSDLSPLISEIYRDDFSLFSVADNRRHR